jgi:hypothetical protein
MENHAAEIELTERRNEKLNEQRKSAPELREYRLVYWLRLILRILSVLTCVLIVFSLVDGIRDFQRTKHVRNQYQDGSGTFPVWPEREGLKLYPTYVLLGAAVVAGGFSLVLVAASFTKAVSSSQATNYNLILTTIQIRRMTKIGNISTIVVSSICLALWIAVTVYFGTWDTSETNWDLL